MHNSVQEYSERVSADLDEGVSTVMLSTSSSASLSRPCLTGRVTTTYLQARDLCEAHV